MLTLTVVAILASIVGLTSTAWSQATSLFFSEYIEGSSFNKATEIYNGTGAPVDLNADGYQIEIYFNGNTTAGATIPLTGTVADGDVYVVAHDRADLAIMTEADETSGSLLFNGNDAVVLVKDGNFVDVIGEVGFDPGSQWGAGDTSTQDNSLRRRPNVCEGDRNGADPFDPNLQWLGFPQDTFDGLGAHSADCTDVAVLLERIEMLESRVGELEDTVQQFKNHTHSYMTGKGQGHNNTPAETGPAIPTE